MGYQVFARRFRPKRFQEVIGQKAILTTLMHALAKERVGAAYLFCGCRGTGKTTLARLFAKALNCAHPQGCEPCNECASCKEISASTALDVLEIDGASHRGIEDIRKINETIYFTPTKGRYKIYLIDEVHMLTKEAFNALLKTLEEPPAHVKFFFATTEPHRIPLTILSRCQRFNLQRLSTEEVVNKLQHIAQQLQLSVEPKALTLIARLSEGSLRDAESLFEQVSAFEESGVTESGVRTVLGLPAEELFERLDKARGCYQVPFEIAHELFISGKNSTYFLEELVEHFRTLLLAKRGVGSHPNSSCYREGQLVDILELLSQGLQSIKTAPSERIHLEMLLLNVVRSHDKLSNEQLVQQLMQLEKRLEKPQPVAVVATPSSQSKADTLMRFAAKELNGALETRRANG